MKCMVNIQLYILSDMVLVIVSKLIQIEIKGKKVIMASANL